MRASGKTSARILALATVAGMALTQGAWAQGKPSAPGQAQARPTLPTAKPPPLGAPMQAQPATPFAPITPLPPRVQVPTPTTPAPLAQQAVPANEPAAVTRLRGLLGQRVRLSYSAAERLDAAGERVRLTGVVLEQPGKRLTADEVLLDGLREDGIAEAVLRGVATSEAGTNVRIAGIRIAGLTVPRTPGGGPPEPDQVRLDQLRIEGVQTSGATDLQLAMASVENWVAGQPARFALEGLAIGGLDGGVMDGLRLARLSVSGMDFGGMLAALMRQQTPPNLVGRTAIDVDRLELLNGGRVVGALAEGRIGADVVRPDGSGTGSVALRGIRVEAMPMVSDWLTRFGYQAMEGEITADSTYDAATGRIEIRDLTVAGRDAGTLSFALTMDGVTQERAQSADFANMRLISMGLRYADASLFRRFIAVQARESRTPEPQLREQMASMAGGALGAQGSGGLDPIRDAMQRFIRGQAQTVEIRVNPPQPIAIGQMGAAPPSPAEAQRMFGVTAEAR